MDNHSTDPARPVEPTPIRLAAHAQSTPRHRRKKGRTGRVVRWIAFPLVALMLLTGGYALFNYQRFVSGVTHVDAIVQPAVDEPVTDIDGVDQNILLVGDDHRPEGATDEDLAKLGTEDDGGGLNTDTMMVLHLPSDGSSATLISFPRDSWVDVPGHGKAKLNAAYSYGQRDGGGDSGGAQLLIQVIQNMTGLNIDHYVRVSMLGFYNVVDALGPVDVCLVNAVNDPYSTTNLPAGVSTLNAQQALAFVRQRHGLPNGDLDRQVRQQYFLNVEARKILSAGTLLNPFKLGQVLDAVSSAVETDPGLNFITLAAQMKDLRADNIVSATIPILGTPTISVGGTPVSIVEVDTAAMPAFISSLVSGPSAYDEAVPSANSAVTVTAINARAVSGVAGEASTALAALGFVTGAPETVATQPTTTIEYPAGMESAAKAVAAYLPGAAVVESATAVGVRLLLGTDGLTVTVPELRDPDDPEDTDPAVPEPESTPVGTTYAAGSCIN